MREGDEGYILLINENEEVNKLMCTNISHATAAMCSTFDYMQNIRTINYSIKLNDKMSNKFYFFKKRIDPQLTRLLADEYYDKYIFSFVH